MYFRKKGMIVNMNKITEFIKRLFGKKQPLLNEKNPKRDVIQKNQKEDFIEGIKIEDRKNDIVSLQIKLEQGTIDEENLNSEQVTELKELYYKQVSNLIDSINKLLATIKNSIETKEGCSERV